mmetsp:Transcript_41382/g.68100  ORF Transcript_41382/g.68100 Transcript_41382/m.68100 type:complete len:201 (+) Transcript_41382:3-605(+)
MMPTITQFTHTPNNSNTLHYYIFLNQTRISLTFPIVGHPRSETYFYNQISALTLPMGCCSLTNGGTYHDEYASLRLHSTHRQSLVNSNSYSYDFFAAQSPYHCHLHPFHYCYYIHVSMAQMDPHPPPSVIVSHHHAYATMADSRNPDIAMLDVAGGVACAHIPTQPVHCVVHVEAVAMVVVVVVAYPRHSTPSPIARLHP